MTEQLVAKTQQYERLLSEALADVEIDYDMERVALAQEHVEMADSYLADGRHFMAEDDYVTALAAFSYGHGWLDAAIRSDLLDAGDVTQPAEARGV